MLSPLIFSMSMVGFVLRLLLPSELSMPCNSTELILLHLVHAYYFSGWYPYIYLGIRNIYIYATTWKFLAEPRRVLHLCAAIVISTIDSLDNVTQIM
jgi:hypothetical protein